MRSLSNACYSKKGGTTIYAAVFSISLFQPDLDFKLFLFDVCLFVVVVEELHCVYTYIKLFIEITK